MNFWEAKAALTLVLLTILTTVAYGGYKKAGNKAGMALSDFLGSMAMTALLLLALWCIWSPYTYRFATGH